MSLETFIFAVSISAHKAFLVPGDTGKNTWEVRGQHTKAQCLSALFTRAHEGETGRLEEEEKRPGPSR